MSKMIRIDKCGWCDYRKSIHCMKLVRELGTVKETIIKDQSIILPNCPLEDYPKEKDPCLNCKKPRGKDEHGAYICPCPHCGDEIPF